MPPSTIGGGRTLGIVEVGGASDDGILDGAANVSLSGLLHLGEDHGGDFLGTEGLGLTLVANLDGGTVVVHADDAEGPVLHIILDLGVRETTPDHTLGIEDGVLGVHGDLVLGGITNQTLRVSEGDVGGGSTVTLIIGNDLHVVVLPAFRNISQKGRQKNWDETKLEWVGEKQREQSTDHTPTQE